MLSIQDNPFASLWAEMSSARWVAGVGLPLIVTIVALGVTVLLVRRQLEQDRDLQRAMRRSEAAAWLSNVLTAEADRLSTFGNHPWWPDAAAINAALARVTSVCASKQRSVISST
jgi:hypothetical protein